MTNEDQVADRRGLLESNKHEAWADTGWTSYGVVTEINPTTSGRFIVKLDVASNPSDCKNKQSFYSDYTVTGADYMFRAL